VKLCALALVLGLLCGAAFAQTCENADFRLKNIDLSSGRGALSSGIFVGVDLTNGPTSMMYQVTSNFAQGMYGVNLGDPTSVEWYLAGSCGFFENSFWAGPFATMKPCSWLKLTAWEGVSAGLAKDPGWNVKYSFSYLAARMTFGVWFAEYSFLSFQSETPNHIPGTGISLPLGSKFSVTASACYTLRDKEPLFSGCLSYSP
jgi:hypothetical protein